MNIFFLMQDTGRIYGAERATLDLLRALATVPSVTARVLLIEESRTENTALDLRNQLRNQAVVFESIPVASACSLSLIRAVRARVCSVPNAVLHTIGYKADVHGVWASGAGRYFPVVSTVHGWLFRQDVKEKFYGWLNIQALKRAQKVVALSSYYQSYLLKQGISPERVHWIPSGLFVNDYSDIHSLSLTEGTLTVGMMGRFSSEKNHAMLIRVAKRLKQMSVPIRFVVAGTGTLFEQVKQHAASEGVADYFSWPGYVDAASFFRDIQLIVMCSRIENLPYTILEAMACGLPVIGTRVGGIPDLIQDGETGFLVPSDDDAALADKLVTCVRDIEQLSRMGARGRDRIVNEFSMQRCLSLYVDLYNDVLKGRGA
jgi:glycosyltransferase involved in cell wall biosynthesis